MKVGLEAEHVDHGKQIEEQSFKKEEKHTAMADK
jgi:hypothetical protein